MKVQMSELYYFLSKMRVGMLLCCMYGIGVSQQLNSIVIGVNYYQN